MLIEEGLELYKEVYIAGWLLIDGLIVMVAHLSQLILNDCVYERLRVPVVD